MCDCRKSEECVVNKKYHTLRERALEAAPRDCNECCARFITARFNAIKLKESEEKKSFCCKHSSLFSVEMTQKYNKEKKALQ
jgi:hypothetical protein